MEMKSNPSSGPTTLTQLWARIKQRTPFGIGRDSSTLLLQRGALRMNRRTCLSVSRAVSITVNIPEG